MEDTGQEAQLEVRAWRDPRLPVRLYSIKFSISFLKPFSDMCELGSYNAATLKYDDLVFLCKHKWF